MHDQTNDGQLSGHRTETASLPSGFDACVAGFARIHVGFSQYIDRSWNDLDVRQLARTLSLHALNAVRLGRMLRTQRRLGTLGPPPIQVDAIIADLNDKLIRLYHYIDTHWPHPGGWQWCCLVDLYSRNAIRLLQLKEHRRALRQDPLAGLHRAIDAARGLLGQEWEADP